MDEIPMGIVLLDDSRRTLRMNRFLAALTGFPPEEIHRYRIPCRQVIRSRLCVTGCPAKGMNADSEPVTVESDLIDRNRQLIPVRITLSPIRDTAGELAGFMESVEDLRPIRHLDARQEGGYRLSGMIGKSPPMEKVFRLIPAIAQSDSSVLITGETGTGKDMAAEAIHMASPRSKGTFVKVNCGALPETLLESEIFGHRKGAFTGAVENKPGRFRMAHNGTLFLTEIGDFPLPLQVKLLTFLDDHVVYPLGGTKGFEADVRVVAGTHRDLAGMVREGRFREDLLFRLNVVRIHLPPLRERGEDVRLLLDHFLNTFVERFGKPISGFSADALALLSRYPYPGNVRELRNIVEYAVNVCNEAKIRPRHLPTYLSEPAGTESFFSGPSRQSGLSSPLETGQSDPSGDLSPEPGGPIAEEGKTWTEVEREMIMDALIRAKGKRGQAADILGWGRSTLWRKMKQHGLDGT